MFHIWEYYLHSLTSDRTHTVVQLFQTKTSQVDFNLEAVWGSLTKRLKNLFIWLTCPVFIDQKLTKTRRMKSTEYDQHRRLHLKITLLVCSIGQNLHFCLGSWSFSELERENQLPEKHRTQSVCEQTRSLQCFLSVSPSQWVLCDKPLEVGGFEHHTECQRLCCLKRPQRWDYPSPVVEICQGIKLGTHTGCVSRGVTICWEQASVEWTEGMTLSLLTIYLQA